MNDDLPPPLGGAPLLPAPLHCWAAGGIQLVPSTSCHLSPEHNQMLLGILIIVLVRPRHTNHTPWPTLCTPCRRATWGTLGSCQTSSGCKSASAWQSFISRKLMMIMMTVIMMMMMMETCAARNIDRSGGRQAEARGRALVEALKTIILITIITIFVHFIKLTLSKNSQLSDH